MTASTPDPLQVLLVGSRPPPSGGTTVLFDQLVAELETRPSLGVHVIDSAARGSRLRAALRLTSELRAALARVEVASFHASPPGLAAFGPAFVRRCKRARRPCVVRFFGGNLDRYYEEGGRVRRARLDRVFRADLVVVESQMLVDWLAAEHPEVRVQKLSNHRPKPERAPRPPRIPDRTLRLIFVGRVSEEKGVAILWQALERLIDIDVTLEILGDTSDAPRRVLQALEADPRVLVQGEIPIEEVPRRIAAADVLVLPTDHFGEGHPGVVLEAYAVGRPVISTNWRAVPEIVSHESTGLLVEPRDPAALAAAISRLARDPALLAHLSEGAARAATDFGTDRAATEFEGWLRQLTSR